MEKIKKFIYRIVKRAIREELSSDLLLLSTFDKSNLNRTSDLARLIVDAKNNKLSFQSRDFLTRMNINPKEF